MAGMALAMPLTMNTASRARKPGRKKGSQSEAAWPVALAGSRLAGAAPGWTLVSAGAGAGNFGTSGRRALRQANHPAINAMKNRAVVAGRPRATGAMDAKTTPTSPNPSRQATTRLRWFSSPPSMAPQDWCRMLMAL